MEERLHLINNFTPHVSVLGGNHEGKLSLPRFSRFSMAMHHPNPQASTGAVLHGLSEQLEFPGSNRPSLFGRGEGRSSTVERGENRIFSFMQGTTSFKSILAKPETPRNNAESGNKGHDSDDLLASALQDSHNSDLERDLPPAWFENHTPPQQARFADGPPGCVGDD